MPDSNVVGAVEDEVDLPIPPLEDDEIIDDTPDDSDLPPEEPDVEEGKIPGEGKRKPKKVEKRRRLTKRAKERQKQTREMTFEEWLQWCENKWGWDKPGVECHLERLYPRQINGIPSGGRVSTRKGSHFTIDEVQENYGGGEYEMIISVPSDTWGQPPYVSRKRFQISGAPKLSSTQVDAAAAEGNLPPQVQGKPDKDLYGMLDKQIARQERLWEERYKDTNRNFSPADIRAPYENSMKMVTEASDRAAQERIQAAESLARDREEKAREAKHEVQRMQQDMREFEEAQRRKVQEAMSQSSNLIGALLPTFSENAAKQVENALRTFEAREARIEEGHAKETQQLNQLHQMQMNQMLQSHQAEMSRAEATWASQKGLLEQQLAHYQMEVQHLRQENTTLRDEMMKLRIAQMEGMQKERDPMTKLGELAQLREAVGDLGFGGGGGGDGLDLGEDSPAWMRFMNNVVQNVAPAVQAAFNRGQPPQPQPNPQQRALVPAGEQLTQEQAAVLQRMQAAQAAQQRAAQERKTKVKRSDMEALLLTVKDAFLAKTPAETVVTIAVRHPEVDVDTLRILAQQDPGRVVQEIEAAGIMPEPLKTVEGRKYVVDLLSALSANL